LSLNSSSTEPSGFLAGISTKAFFIDAICLSNSGLTLLIIGPKAFLAAAASGSVPPLSPGGKLPSSSANSVLNGSSGNTILLSALAPKSLGISSSKLNLINSMSSLISSNSVTCVRSNSF